VGTPRRAGLQQGHGIFGIWCIEGVDWLVEHAGDFGFADSTRMLGQWPPLICSAQVVTRLGLETRKVLIAQSAKDYACFQSTGPARLYKGQQGRA